MNPVMGYGNPSFMHPAQMRFAGPSREPIDKDRAQLLSPGNRGPQLPADAPPKALDLLQQHASQYYGSQGASHKIHELAEAGKSEKGSPRKESPSPVPASKETPRDSKSPPPQRHLHTHHHTHVMGTPFPIFQDPYTGK